MPADFNPVSDPCGGGNSRSCTSLELEAFPLHPATQVKVGKCIAYSFAKKKEALAIEHDKEERITSLQADRFLKLKAAVSFWVESGDSALAGGAGTEIIFP